MIKKIQIFILLVLLGACSLNSSEQNVPFPVFKTETVQDFPVDADYVIYYDQTTLPTLYISMHMFTHNKPSFIFTGRAGTLNPDKLPPHVSMLNTDDELKNKVEEINKKNPKATFLFLVIGTRSSRLLIFFNRLNIGADRVRTIMLDEGSAMYDRFRLLSTTTIKRFQYTLLFKFHELLPFIPINDNNFFCGFSLAPILYKNISVWLLHPELLRVDKDQEYWYTGLNKYHKVSLQDSFLKFSPEYKQKYLELMHLDKRWAPDEGGGTLNNQTIGEAFAASPKANILITGTKPYNPSGVDTDQLIERVKKHFGEGYDYFYKGHPAEMTKPSDSSIVVLPYRLPMEAILFTLGTEIYAIGGYESSLYMSASPKTKKFFFNEKEDGSSLISPLDQMYKLGLLGDDIIFFNP